MMAQIHHTIYLQQQAPDIVGNISRGMEAGMRLSDMARKRKLDEEARAKQKAIEDAYKQ